MSSAAHIPQDLDHWLNWVTRFADLLNNKPQPAPPRASSGDNKAHCLIFAPHPDDEVIIGALPLRLKQEAGWQVTNVAVTLGSNKARRQARWSELEAACSVIGFANIRLKEDGFEEVKPSTSTDKPELWAEQVRLTAELLKREQPQLLLLPHVHDGNPTHIGVHRLVLEAVQQAGVSTVLAETEFWSTMDSPNWMVETSNLDTAKLVQALTRHVGEVERNPYHLRLPAFMADCVRRGGELIAGAGSAVPDYAFATLYRLTLWRDGVEAQALPSRLCPADLALKTEFITSAP